MKFRFQRLFVVVVTLINISFGAAESLLQLKQTAQNSVKNIAKEVERLFKNRCSQESLKCKTKSYNGCFGTSERECFEDFGHVDKCFDKGILLGVETELSFPGSVDADNLSKQDTQFICATVGIDDLLKETSKSPHKWVYIGNKNGVMRTYPSITFDCTDYDPRFRPWYIAATSGRKNVIIFIDTSGTMALGSPSRITMAKQAAISVVGSLSPGDTMSVIRFNSEAESLGFNKIVPSTHKNKADLISAIKKVRAEVSVNSYQIGFEKAFQLLQQSRNDKKINCWNKMNVFLFMTDGSPEDQDSQNALMEYLEQKEADYPFHLFTYRIGGNANNAEASRAVLKQLSCRFHGIYFQIQNSTYGSELADIMRQYYVFISYGVKIQQAIWTEPYYDPWLQESALSVAYPFYYQDQQNGNRILLGVAGLDVFMSDLEPFGITQDNVILAFVNDIPCQQYVLSECNLQDLRKQASNYSICEIDPTEEQSCPKKSIFDPSCEDRTYPPSTQLFLEPKDSEYDVCCGITKRQFIIILATTISSFVAFVVIVVVVCVCRRRRNLQNEQSQKSKKDQNNQQTVKNMETEGNLQDQAPTFHNMMNGVQNNGNIQGSSFVNQGSGYYGPPIYMVYNNGYPSMQNPYPGNNQQSNQ